MSEPDHRLRRGNLPPLRKQNSWSPDVLRDEAWTNRRRSHRTRRGRSVTDDDLDELRACFELGFDFDSPDLDPKLSSTFPALELYHAVNRRYGNNLSRSSSASFSDCDSASSSLESSFIDPSDDPEMVKTRLRHWAQVVACSVRQSPTNL
ncbi:membrane insertase [Perilla frutescens var. hirtella]|nr:membrane insertase [Perilla frutescens var. frutescens]KAH6794032.1 membrane insertase [Perilla frutescens var. hirtella]